jgi:hypothetical protein
VFSFVGTPGSVPSAAVFGRRRRAADDENVVIDLTDHVPTLGQQAAMAERGRAVARRREAEREVLDLRARHWSAERVLEEGALDVDFWEHWQADPYAVLGLLPGATLEEAAAARKRIAVECHPDVVPGAERAEAAARMQAANNAYERLRQALRPVD